MKGKVQTVLGLVDPDELGKTLTHEHLLHSLEKNVFKKERPSVIRNSEYHKFTMENLGWIRQYPYSFDINLQFDDDAVMEAVTEEMKLFKSVDGGTVVENSSWGLRSKNQADFMKKLSEETGVKIVLGTGFYVGASQKPEVLNYSMETIEGVIKKEMIDGLDGTGVKCGVIGEIGCSWPLLPFERSVLVSSGSVQEELHCPVIIHPGRDRKAPEEIMRIFQESGGKASQTVMSHLDRTLTCVQDLAEFASLGSFCEMDLFGVEVSHYQPNENVDMPSDAQRISRIRYLVDQGYGDNIVISHDIHTKHRLMKYGGHGYSHILINIVPKMFNRGISSDIIEKFLVSNPKRWLTFQ